MRRKVNRDPSQQVLTRLLDAFAQELIETRDEELLDVAKELGMDPWVRGSAAFAGVTYPARPQLSDFFDLQSVRAQLSIEPKRPSGK